MINMGSQFREPDLPSATLPRATPIRLVYSHLLYCAGEQKFVDIVEAKLP